jgi:formate dehydrogenase iron-sulfur subunit
MNSAVPGSIYKDEDTGAVIYTEKSKYEDFDNLWCPREIPRQDKNTGQVFKCTMCMDRVKNGMPPACVKACPTGAINFGDREEMQELAKVRLKEVKSIHKSASLMDDMEDVSVFYLLTEKEELYGIVRNSMSTSAFA